MTPLSTALALAQHGVAYETTVFVVREGSAFLYRTSRQPDVYNSTVVTMELC